MKAGLGVTVVIKAAVDDGVATDVVAGVPRGDKGTGLGWGVKAAVTLGVAGGVGATTSPKAGEGLNASVAKGVRATVATGVGAAVTTLVGDGVALGDGGGDASTGGEEVGEGVR